LRPAKNTGGKVICYAESITILINRDKAETTHARSVPTNKAEDSSSVFSATIKISVRKRNAIKSVLLAQFFADFGLPCLI
jgi:excinuclease UvrABC helicase subunit UvrB